MRRSWLVAATLASLASGAAWAEDPAVGAADPSAEQRRTMAEIHRKMADCLDSARPIAECRAEMQASCQSRMGSQGCPMAGWAGGGRHGRMGPGGPMMPGAPAAPKAPPSD
jgi:hypothetical protein